MTFDGQEFYSKICIIDQIYDDKWWKKRWCWCLEMAREFFGWLNAHLSGLSFESIITCNTFKDSSVFKSKWFSVFYVALSDFPTVLLINKSSISVEDSALRENCGLENLKHFWNKSFSRILFHIGLWNPSVWQIITEYRFQIFVHPEYNDKSIQKFNDIAIIRLKHRVSFTHFVMPICLPNKAEENSFETGQMFSVSGWGRTDFCKYILKIITKCFIFENFYHFKLTNTSLIYPVPLN